MYEYSLLKLLNLLITKLIGFYRLVFNITCQMVGYSITMSEKSQGTANKGDPG